MNGVVLVKYSLLFGFSHQDDNRAGTIEDSISSAFICFPGRDELAETLMKEFFINFDLCHDC